MCNLNVIVVLDFINRDLYLLFAIRFTSKFQNSVFYQHMRPKSGLKFPRPLFIFNPKPLLPDMNSYTKFEENPSINAQNTVRKQNFNVNQGP